MIFEAIGGRRFDIVHGHQPQIADLCDVFQCHFLTRVAYEQGCLEMRSSLRARAVRLQQQLALYAEDRCYSRWNPSTRMLFCSDLVRVEFARLYRLPPSQEVLSNPCPQCSTAGDQERTAARAKLLGRVPPGPVVGYLGGVQERKGYRRLVNALSTDTGTTVIFAGPYTEDLPPEERRPWIVPVGLVNDTNAFYAACDIVVVPSYFDPCPLVVLEAVARGVPVIATDGVGNLPQLVQYGAGMRWDGRTPLTNLVRDLMGRHAAYQAGAAQMADGVSLEKYERRLMAIYHEVLESRIGFASARPERHLTPLESRS